MKKTAIISLCGKYRYQLGREWADGPTCVFVMLNPSTADAKEDDHTIRRCIGYAKREGCGKLLVVNLFAHRTKSPKIMRAAPDPVGVANDDWIEETVRGAKVVIAAWGTNGDHHGRARTVRRFLSDTPMYALGLTKGRSPCHPLRLRLDAPLIPYNFAAEEALNA